MLDVWRRLHLPFTGDARLGDVADVLAGDVHLGDLTAVLARRYPGRTAVLDPDATPGLHDGGERRYEDIEEAVGRLAAAHAAAGRREGDHVLVAVDNRIDVVLHTLALARVGAVPVPVNPRLASAEIGAVAAAAGAGAAVADPDVAERLEADETCEGLELAMTGDAGLAGWLRANPGVSVAPAGRSPSGTALLLTTSGTTGVPKAAALTSRGLLKSMGLLAGLPLGAQRGPRSGRDLVFAALPLAHVMGMAVVLACLCAGVPLLRRPSFDAADTLDLIEQERPNVFVGVPTMYADLEAAGAAERDLTSVQLWISSADVMPAARARRFQTYGAVATAGGTSLGTAVFLDVYGLVELSGAAAFRVYPPSPSRHLRLPAAAVVAPGLDVRAVDEHGDRVRWGREGELQFRGRGVLEGYEGRDDVGPGDDGWFPTGDYGRVWPGGVFQFSGRSRDRLKVGGFSVFPAEVEEELRGASGVRELAVVGVPDERLGERPVALVVAENPADFDADGFLSWSADRVAGYRRPRDVVLVDAVPRGNNAKVDRQAATTIAEERLAGGARD